jgi:hypothetical protein
MGFTARIPSRPGDLHPLFLSFKTSRYELLGEYVVGRPDDQPLWPGSWSSRSADMLKLDLAAADIPYTVDGRDGVEHLDFHSLRVTYINSLARAGVHPTLAK